LFLYLNPAVEIRDIIISYVESETTNGLEEGGREGERERESERV